VYELVCLTSGLFAGSIITKIRVGLSQRPSTITPVGT
jgi:hypothetical protein